MLGRLSRSLEADSGRLWDREPPAAVVLRAPHGFLGFILRYLTSFSRQKNKGKTLVFLAQGGKRDHSEIDFRGSVVSPNYYIGALAPQHLRV